MLQGFLCVMPHAGQKLGKEGKENVKNSISNAIAVVNNVSLSATTWIHSVLFSHYMIQEMGSNIDIRDTVIGSIHKGTNTESRRKGDKV